MKTLFTKLSTMIHKKSNASEDSWNPIRESMRKGALNIQPQLSHCYHLYKVIFDCPSEAHKGQLMELFSHYDDQQTSEGIMRGERLNKFVENELRPHIYEVKVDPLCEFGFEIHQTPTWKMSSKEFGCTFYGEWEKIDPKTSSHPTLTLEIKDAEGTRTLTLEKFPVVVGKLVSELDIRIHALFTSGKHATLQYEAGSIVWEDTSTNGTFINGEKIHQQRKELKGKEVIILGSNTKQSYADFAQITVLACAFPSVPNEGMALIPTPMPEVPNTPVELEVQPTPMKKALYFIDVRSYEGSTTYDLEEMFPITIGRGKDQTIRIPSDTLADSRGIHRIESVLYQRNTVSRHHLEILGTTPEGDGVRVQSVGTHGTTLEGKRMEGETIVLFNQTMELGIDNPPVHLTIRKEGATQ